MNGGMKDMANLMSKFLCMGLSLQDVILRSTWNPAKIINRPELGNLSVGTEADMAIFSLSKGNFGFLISMENVYRNPEIDSGINYQGRQNCMGSQWDCCI